MAIPCQHSIVSAGHICTNSASRLGVRCSTYPNPLQYNDTHPEPIPLPDTKGPSSLHSNLPQLVRPHPQPRDRTFLILLDAAIETEVTAHVPRWRYRWVLPGVGTDTACAIRKHRRS